MTENPSIRCPKCNCIDIDTQYKHPDHFIDERLRKKCSNCSYTWTEPCADKASEEEEKLND